MPFDQAQRVAAAASSARARRTRNLLTQLSTCRPLTADQKQALIEAAAAIPVVAA
jgi:cell division inhibitor SulA